MAIIFLELSASGGCEYRACKRESVPRLLDITTRHLPPDSGRPGRRTLLLAAEGAGRTRNLFPKYVGSESRRGDGSGQYLDCQNAALGCRRDRGDHLLRRLPHSASPWGLSPRKFNSSGSEKLFEADGERQLMATWILSPALKLDPTFNAAGSSTVLH